MLSPIRIVAAGFVIAAAGASGTSVLGCHKPPQQRPAVGLQKPVDPPDMPELGRGAPRADVHVLYNIYLDEGVRSVCAGPSPYFKFDSSKAKQSEPTMANLAFCMQHGPLKGKSIRLIGHTDPRGTEQYNEELGLERAQRVKKYLEEHGVAGERIKAATAGEEDASRAPADWPTDRRVEIQLDR